MNLAEQISKFDQLMTLTRERFLTAAPGEAKLISDRLTLQSILIAGRGEKDVALACIVLASQIDLWLAEASGANPEVSK